MSKAKSILRAMSAGLFIGMLLAGCISAKKVTVVRTQPDCPEALAEGISSLTDRELSELLDDAGDGNGLNDCWMPLVKACLNENRDISREHLVNAIKIFNKRQHEPYFHKALYRYFAELTENPNEYRPEDRKLLESYCSYLINAAESSRDRTLRQTKLLCRKLDRSLYARLFE